MERISRRNQDKKLDTLCNGCNCANAWKLLAKKNSEDKKLDEMKPDKPNSKKDEVKSVESKPGDRKPELTTDIKSDDLKPVESKRDDRKPDLTSDIKPDTPKEDDLKPDESKDDNKKPELTTDIESEKIKPDEHEPQKNTEPDENIDPDKINFEEYVPPNPNESSLTSSKETKLYQFKIAKTKPNELTSQEPDKLNSKDTKSPPSCNINPNLISSDEYVPPKINCSRNKTDKKMVEESNTNAFYEIQTNERKAFGALSEQPSSKDPEEAESNESASPKQDETHDHNPIDGECQSPIDIVASRVIEDGVHLSPIYIDYPSSDIGEILSNTGHGWKVQCNGRKTEFYGGPLENKFKLEQFHCHWGPNPGVGSEHTVDGKSYSGELHFVHYNAEKYDSFESASQQKDGLAVLGVFLDIGPANSELLKITALLPRCKNAGDQINLQDLIGINLEQFLPTGRNYWTYAGSLTTPPYSETVTWIILEEPITISEQQLNVFRLLKMEEHCLQIQDSFVNKAPGRKEKKDITINKKESDDDENSKSIDPLKIELENIDLEQNNKVSVFHVRRENLKDKTCPCSKDNSITVLESNRILQNYREIQPLNNRVIRKYTATEIIGNN